MSFARINAFTASRAFSIAPYGFVRLRLPPGRYRAGRGLARLIQNFPAIYMSGASAGQWPPHPVPNSILIEKPFAPAHLLTAVSQLLNAGSPLTAPTLVPAARANYPALPSFYPALPILPSLVRASYRSPRRRSSSLPRASGSLPFWHFFRLARPAISMNRVRHLEEW